MANVVTGKKIDRRTFLYGTGAAVALPLLDAMTPAFAVESARPTRLGWFQTPNGSEMTWDFSKILTNVQLPPQDFERPAALDPGWQFQVMPEQQPGGPTKVRSSGG